MRSSGSSSNKRQIGGEQAESGTKKCLRCGADDNGGVRKSGGAEEVKPKGARATSDSNGSYWRGKQLLERCPESEGKSVKARFVGLAGPMLLGQQAPLLPPSSFFFNCSSQP